MIAICVGHSRIGDNGAVSVDGTSEWEYNRELAGRVVGKLWDLGIESQSIDYYAGDTYGEAMRWVGAETKTARAALELHFNAYNGHANGAEWLYWHSSTRGLALARALQNQHRGKFTGHVIRGLKGCDMSNRGAGFLRYTQCPAVICEPFFGDNALDWELFANAQDDLATAVAAGVFDWLESNK